MKAPQFYWIRAYRAKMYHCAPAAEVANRRRQRFVGTLCEQAFDPSDVREEKPKGKMLCLSCDAKWHAAAAS